MKPRIGFLAILVVLLLVPSLVFGAVLNPQPNKNITNTVAAGGSFAVASFKVSGNAGETILKVRLQGTLAGGLVLLAQGIPFIHSGQEMCRTKKGDENSHFQRRP